MELKNKVFVVTGAGNGMGRELTIQLVNHGAKVAMVDLNKESLIETKKLTDSSKVSMHVLNITDRNSVENLPDLIIKNHGAVDAIINNAGIIHEFIDINNMDYDTIDKVLNVNLNGTINMVKSFLPHLLKRPQAHIANVSSMGGFIPFPRQTLYSASKAAVKVFTEGLYAELKETNVGVTIILPGAINTNIVANSGIDLSESNLNIEEESSIKLLPADKAASIILKAIKKNKFRILVGKDARILDYIYRLSPKRAVNMITNKMKFMT